MFALRMAGAGTVPSAPGATDSELASNLQGLLLVVGLQASP